jgi:D-3-phosphoglycerate dehydrogenase
MIMTFRVLVAEPIHKDGIDLLRKHVEIVELPPKSTVDDLRDAASDVDAIISRGFIKITREVLSAAKRLKVIVVHGVGIDHIDLEAAKELGIKVVNTPEALTNAVAEFTVGLIFSLIKRIPLADKAVRRGEWHRKFSDLIGIDLSGKTVGIIGLGRIGSAVARMLRAFNVRLIYYSPRRKYDLEKELGIEFRPLHELLKESDVISIHATLTKETYHMISYEEFELMKDGVYIVNTARGAIMDEKAFLEYLESGKIGGAALDVFETEPLPEDSPLLKFDNLILTPHLAASSVDSLRRLAIDSARRTLQELGLF